MKRLPPIKTVLRMKFRRLVSFATAVTLFSLPAYAGQKLSIGLLLPPDDSPPLNRLELQNSAILAASLIYNAAGEEGTIVEILSFDSRGKPYAASAVAGKMVAEEGVTAIIGPYDSETLIETSREVALNDRVVMISPFASSSEISILDDQDLVFSTAPTVYFEGEKLALAASDRGYKKIGIIHSDSLYGRGLSGIFQKVMENKGGEITAIVSFSEGRTSFRSELLKALEDKPEALLVIAYPQNGIRILKQAVKIDPDVSFIFPGSMKNLEIIAGVGPGNLDGSFGTAPSPPERPLTQKFRTAYGKMFGERAETPYVVNTFDAVILAALAAARGENTGGTAISENLRKVANPPGEKVDFTTMKKAFTLIKSGIEIDYEGISGPVDFDSRGDVSGGTFRVWTIEGDIIKDLATSEKP